MKAALALLLGAAVFAAVTSAAPPAEVECTKNHQCPANRACKSNECVNPCVPKPCGKNAICTVKNRLPVCSCHEGEVGDPFESCAPHSFGNLCDGACGFNAKCVIKDRKPSCSCPENTTGDHYEYCNIKRVQRA